MPFMNLHPEGSTYRFYAGRGDANKAAGTNRTALVRVKAKKRPPVVPIGRRPIPEEIADGNS
jgi:hypothetical protein